MFPSQRFLEDNSSPNIIMGGSAPPFLYMMGHCIFAVLLLYHGPWRYNVGG